MTPTKFQHRVLVASLFLPHAPIHGIAEMDEHDNHPVLDEDSNNNEGIPSRPLSTDCSNLTVPMSRSHPDISGGSRSRDSRSHPPSIVEDLTAAKNRSPVRSFSPADQPAIVESLSNPFSSSSSNNSQHMSRTTSSTHLALSKPGFGSKLSTMPTLSPKNVPPSPIINSSSSKPAPKSPDKISPTSACSQVMFPYARRTPRRRSSNISSSLERSSNSSVHSQILSPTPFHFHPYPHGNGGLQNAFASADDLLQETLWIGSPAVPMDDWTITERADLSKRYREEHNSRPVYVSDDTMETAYDLFCKGYLWGALHYQLPEETRAILFEDDTYAAYVALNRAFADNIIEEYKEGDMIMINDYHLMLVPAMVREKLRDAPIGYFLHVAFPSSEIFRCLPMRENLLRGILGADLIGFQTYNFSRHFRINVSRILSLETNPRGVYNSDGTFSHTHVFPIGINVAALEDKLVDDEVGQWEKILKDKYKGYRLLVGRDKLDSIKGVRQKLLAFERFLERHSEFEGKVVLIQLALATTGENEQQTKVNDVVQRINNRFSKLEYQPVVFLHQDVTFGQYLALLKIADVFLAFPVREGMNLTSHEYVIAQRGQYNPLILSEFAGTYSYSGFRSCIAINPWDIGGSGEAIYQALTMPKNECYVRWKELEHHVLYQTSQQWVHSYVLKLERVSLEHYLGKKKQLPRFDVEKARKTYSKGSRRLIFIDLEHTLIDVDDQYGSPGMSISNESIEMLQTLESDPKNQIYVLSAQSTSEIDRILSDMKDVGKVAENGCWIQYPRSTKWINLVQNANLEWRQHVLETLRYFTVRNPGSLVDDRGTTICWHFWTNNNVDVEWEWARRMAAEVQNHIMDSLGEKYSLYIYSGSNSFLVTLKNATKSNAVWRVLQHNQLDRETGSTPVLPNSEPRSLDTPASRGDWTPFNEEMDTDANGYANAGRGEVSTALLRRLSEMAMSQSQPSFDVLLYIGQDPSTFTLLKGVKNAKCVLVSVDGPRRDADYIIPNWKAVINDMESLGL